MNHDVREPFFRIVSGIPFRLEAWAIRLLAFLVSLVICGLSYTPLSS
jgi:hypothetical protein